MPKKVAPSIFCEFFWQISLTETSKFSNFWTFFDQFPTEKRFQFAPQWRSCQNGANFRIFWLFWQISTNFSERKAFSPLSQRKSCQNGANFRIFCQFFAKFLWQKRFQSKFSNFLTFYDKFRQISTNFSERKAFSPPPKENGANFQIFCQFFAKFLWQKRFLSKFSNFWTFFDKFRQISLRERLSVSPPMKIMPKWRQFLNFLTFFDKFRQIPLRETFFPPPNENHAEMPQILEFLTIFDKAPIILQKAEKNSILGGIWSKNVRKLAKMFKFQALLSKRVTRPSKIFKNWQKFSNFKHSFQREWPKPAKFSNWVRFGPKIGQKCSKIGQNVQILSASFKRSDKTQQNFQKLAKIFEF